MTPTLIDYERRMLLRSLDPDPNTAQRLLNELRQRRGMGPTRFDMLLRRNAGLRLLVGEDVGMTDDDIRNAFELEYGPRFQPRVIVTQTLREAGRLAAEARASTSPAAFIDLAAAHSTDVSRAQGGLLDPISPVDPSYPLALRNVLARLEVGQISDPVALADGQFAVVRLERKIEPSAVRLDDVRMALRERVLRSRQSVAMQQLARQMILEASVIVTDPTLNAAWTQQVEQLR